MKKPLSRKDIQIVVDLFEKLQPDQIFAAGDLSDPHGTHRTCLQVAPSIPPMQTCTCLPGSCAPARV